MTKFPKTTALIVVDLQNDFITGTMAVQKASAIITPINELSKRFETVILTQDYHPSNHVSFADTHDLPQLSVMNMPYGQQVLWAKHCVQGEWGAELSEELNITHARLIVRKGCRQDVDSYSAFIEADGKQTGLDGYLRQIGVDRVFVVGIATDFCVSWTAMDATKLGYQCVVITDASVAIDVNDSFRESLMQMQALGVTLMTIKDVLNQ
ncbi:nicotinamidase [Moraxella sp. Tifton1]|uniref:nicotinamidase n=1 Tax=Moraxella oculi TaxID=2940516 RepID=A0ABW8U2Y2_9GAMM|nr:nicotinamidase [Moraxella sp. Tifton1]MCL1623184.1 nicotinamidase [Moraxella sp. Tifton1]